MACLLRLVLITLLLLPDYLSAQINSKKTIIESPDMVAIRVLRKQSNQSIQSRDLAGFGQTMLPEIEVTRGSGSHVSGRDSVLASVAVQFKDPAFLGYIWYSLYLGPVFALY